MPDDNILEKVKQVVVDQLTVEYSDVKPESSFQDDLGADSLDLVELMMGMEEEFEIKIDDEAAQSIRTVSDAVNFIKKQLEQDKG
ncbi:MAG: acyl carrier protein [Deltaproteobacteria bacterium]|jgi:acyl carrier protein|nr:acyl carrier protein [Deltaproteobacteria bacterium]